MTPDFLGPVVHNDRADNATEQAKIFRTSVARRDNYLERAEKLERAGRMLEADKMYDRAAAAAQDALLAAGQHMDFCERGAKDDDHH
jgi:hypothetical protein